MDPLCTQVRVYLIVEIYNKVRSRRFIFSHHGAEDICIPACSLLSKRILETFLMVADRVACMYQAEFEASFWSVHGPNNGRDCLGEVLTDSGKIIAQVKA
jgi:hypothetical protein